MANATLTIDLGALVRNWQALDAKSAPSVVTAAVVKADSYGLGAEAVTRALFTAGVRTFFVATAEEAVRLRLNIGPEPVIYILSGHMEGDTKLIGAHDVIPMLSSPGQITRHFQRLPNHPFGVQLDTGMNRLGLEPEDWQALKTDLVAKGPALIMSHLACSDEPDHPMNAQQLATFRGMTDDIDVPRSFAATGGILLGPEYHFDIARPGVGLYGGLPFTEAEPVVHVEVPVIQTRQVAPGETVGYSNTWTAQRPSTIATLAAGYADGLLRALGKDLKLWSDKGTAPVVGRVSMDMIGVDVTDLQEIPERFSILNAYQTIDQLAEVAGTIGYEILTNLGTRYQRLYTTT